MKQVSNLPVPGADASVFSALKKPPMKQTPTATIVHNHIQWGKRTEQARTCNKKTSPGQS